MKKVICMLVILMTILSSASFAGGWNPSNNPRYQYKTADFTGSACKADGSTEWVLKDGVKVLNPPPRGFFKKCNYNANVEPWPWEVGAYPVCYDTKKAIWYPGCSVQPTDG